MDREAFPEKADFAFTIGSGMPRRKKEDTGFGLRLTAIRQARLGALSPTLVTSCETIERIVIRVLRVIAVEILSFGRLANVCVVNRR